MEKTRWFLPLYKIYGCQGQGAQRSLSFVGGVRKSLFPKFMEEPQRATVTHSGASRASEGKRNFVPALSNHLSWLSARLSPGCGRGLFCPHSGSCHLLVAGLWPQQESSRSGGSLGGRKSWCHPRAYPEKLVRSGTTDSRGAE